MANPQVEDGHTKIANELLDALMRQNMASYDRRILDCIFRKTYGWNKTTDAISYSQFEAATGIKRWHIARSLKRLQERNIITVSGQGQHLEYGIQKNYEDWQPLPNQVTQTITYSGNEPLPNEVIDNTNKPLPIQEKPLPNEVTKPLPNQVNTKERKTIQKKGNISLKEKTLEIAETLRGKYPNLDFDHQMEKFMAYWFDGGRKLKNPKLAIMNWMDKASEFKKPVKSTWGVV